MATKPIGSQEGRHPGAAARGARRGGRRTGCGPALGVEGVPRRRQAAQVGSYTVPALGWDRTQPREVPTPGAGRNLFTFGAPPTPTPDRRPTADAPAASASAADPDPAGIYVDGKWILPPPPPFTLSYLGWLGPDRLPVAVFRDGDDVLAVPVGETCEAEVRRP